MKQQTIALALGLCSLLVFSNAFELRRSKRMLTRTPEEEYQTSLTERWPSESAKHGHSHHHHKVKFSPEMADYPASNTDFDVDDNVFASDTSSKQEVLVRAEQFEYIVKENAVVTSVELRFDREKPYVLIGVSVLQALKFPDDWPDAKKLPVLVEQLDKARVFAKQIQGGTRLLERTSDTDAVQLGTGGVCFYVKSVETNRVLYNYILTSFHGTLGKGKTVMSTVYDEETKHATLENIGTVEIDEVDSNHDYALVKLQDNIQCLCKVGGRAVRLAMSGLLTYQQIKEYMASPLLRPHIQDVWLHGAVSKFKEGTISGFDSGRLGGSDELYSDHILLPADMAQPGDSGAAVIHKQTGRVMGIVRGGLQGVDVIVTPIHNILQDLQSTFGDKFKFEVCA